MQYPNHPPPGGGVPSFPPPPPPPQPSQPPLPPGWVQTTDPSTGCPYYANPTTGQTSWEPPPYFPPPPPPVNPSIPPPPPNQNRYAPPFQQPPYTTPFHQAQQSQPPQNHHNEPNIHEGPQQAMSSSIAQPVIPVPATFPQPTQSHLQYPPIPSQHISPSNFQIPPQNMSNNYIPTQQPTQLPHQTVATTSSTKINPIPSIPTPSTSTSTATFSVGPSTATTPGLLVSSVRSMIEAEYTQRANSSSVPRLELDGLTAGCIADLCNVSREYRSRNLRVDKGDFADDDENAGEALGKASVGGSNGNGNGSGNSFSMNSDNGEKNTEEEEAMNQYYLPLQPFQLPMASRPPHIEPGRVDIRLHALYNKLGRI
ncbi:hypothetical protein ACHAXS_014069 [Conticribra weissflogii]